MIRPLCAAAIATLIAISATSTSAEIVVGPWTFDDLAFADDATQIDTGDVTLWCGATDLDDALTGYSPDRQLVNTGFGSTSANLFQLDFVDLQPMNETGPDIVFFDGRFSPDAYEIAVRQKGGAFSAFVDHPETAFIEAGLIDCSAIFGVEIELDDFGVPAGATVDAIRFRARLVDGRDFPEGDPVMAAALNGSSTPIATTSWTRIKSTYR